MAKQKIYWDVIDDIIASRPPKKSKQIDIPTYYEQLEYEKKGKRYVKDHKYYQKYKVDGKTKTLHWSSNKKTIKQYLEKQEEKQLQNRLSKYPAKPKSRKSYITEEIKTNNGYTFYVKYGKKRNRKYQIKKLIFHYGFTAFHTVRIDEKTYSDEEFISEGFQK